MFDLDAEVCICNSKTIRDVAECIKENNIATFEELLENDICPVGDKCESCHVDGFNNDGLNLHVVLSMVKNNKA